MTAAATLELLTRTRAFAVLRGISPAAMPELLGELAEGGLRAAEVSLSAPDGLEALRRAVAAARADDRVTIGAGTVRTVAQADAALAAGAQFLVAPGLATDVVARAAADDVLHLPGVMTPSEVDQALQAGAHAVKLFPAARLGPGYIRDLLGPFPALRIAAVGGVDAKNAAAFLAAGACCVGYGSSLLPQDGMTLDFVVAAVRDAVQAVSPSRPTKETHAH
jgi:2-dehydro-3-deoxyphosphogluconate aldolase / (4S)-4-hydroxy-2-oxoglutarate aldolase